MKNLSITTALVILLGGCDHVSADDCHRSDYPPFTYWAIDTEAGSISVMREGVEVYAGPVEELNHPDFYPGQPYSPESPALAYFSDVIFREVCRNRSEAEVGTDQ